MSEQVKEVEALDVLVQKYWAQCEAAEAKKAKILERLLNGEKSELVTLILAKPIIDEKSVEMQLTAWGVELPKIITTSETTDVNAMKTYFDQNKIPIPVIKSTSIELDDKRIKAIFKLKQTQIPTKVNPNGIKPHFKKRSEQ